MNIHEWDHILYEMGIKEKEHEVYFLEKIKESKLLPFFEDCLTGEEIRV
jgi:hypothetical protein